MSALPLTFRTEREVEVNLLKPLFQDVLGYPIKELEWAKKVKVTFGHETKTKEADLVAHFGGSPMIAVEAKKPTEPVRNAMGQVDSYAFALRTPFSVVTNGRQFVLRGYYSFNSRINVIDEPVEDLQHAQWKKVKNLISFDNIRAAIKEPAIQIQQPSEERIQDYRRFFRKIHNEIRDRERLDPAAAFDELSKLLFLKAAEDEWQQQSTIKPVLTPEKIDEWESLGHGKASALVNEWFKSATEQLFPGVFDDHPRILLSPGTLKAVLEQMRPFHVKNGDVDVKGRAFEEFLPSQLRGKGLGQYFTPRPIVNFMADLASISIQDVVLDFSCGSGGFLIKAFEQMKAGVEQLPNGTLARLGTTRQQMLDDLKTKQLFGVDAEPRAARTAKMNMLMWGDGKQVVRGNALDTRDFGGKLYEPAEFSASDSQSGCTLILANPPFGSKEKDEAVLNRYSLAGRSQERKAARTEVLFIEKGLKVLRPEGKMLIVLPQGLMSGSSNARVRDYIHSEAEIRAIISLPTHTFVQSGVPTVNTCILYLQKFTAEKKRLYDTKTAGLSVEGIRELLRSDAEFDYPIFMGTAEYIGYEPSGRMIVKPEEQTDLDLLLKDYASQSSTTRPDVNVFAFASQHYSDRSFRRKDQIIRGTVKDLKTSFIVPLSQTDERLDPPFYFFRYQTGKLLGSLKPLCSTVTEAKRRFRPTTDDELDAEYPILSISSDGKVSLSGHVKGEEFKQMKRVRHNDIVYNPMRVNIGSIGVVPKELDGGLVSPDYVVFRSDEFDPGFLVTLLRAPFYRMYIDVISTGSIRDRLYFSDLRTICVPEVSEADQKKVCDAAARVEAEAHELLDRLVNERSHVTSRLNRFVRAAGTYSSDAIAAKAKFNLLVEQWRNATGHLSSLGRKMAHPAYQQILDMGHAAVPLILEDLRARGGHWFAALTLLTGEDPAHGHITILEARNAWVAWGISEGYLSNAE